MLIADQIVLKRDQRVIAKPLSFKVSTGQCLELVGPNGSGKTSLLRLLSRQVQPFQGKIQYDLRDSKPLYLGLQSGFDLSRTLEDNLVYLCALENQNQSLTAKALIYFNLIAFRNKSFGTLSAGQKQCAHLMRLILWPRTCWLLDEPVTSLDSWGENLLHQLCQNHLSQGGIIMIASPKPLGWGEIIHIRKKDDCYAECEQENTSWI